MNDSIFRTRHAWLAVLIVFYVIGFILLGLGIGIWTGFHVSLTDFWGNLFLARHFDLRQSATWFNGFFPVGYTIFLRLLPSAHILTAAYAANIILMAMLLLGIGWSTTRILGAGWGLIATILASIHPLLFQHAQTPGADIGCATWATLAALILITPALDFPKRPRFILLSGALFGLSALWRYHGLVLAFAFLVSIAAISPRPWRLLGYGLTGLVLVYAAQLTANYFSGHGWLETSQVFNVYRMVHGVDFQHLPAAIPNTVGAIIQQSPRQFLTAYSRALAQSAYLILPTLIGLVILPRRHRPLMAALTLAMAIYLLITGIAFSPRGLIPMAPFFILGLVVLARGSLDLMRADNWFPRFAGFIVGLGLLGAVGVSGYTWLKTDAAFVRQARAHNRICREVSRILVQQEQIANPQAVFTDSFELYLPGMPPYYPVNTGGWLRYDSAQYRQEYPALNMTNLFMFLDDCRRQSISHLALAPQAGALMTELGQIYKGQVMPHDLQPVGQCDAVKIYRLVE